MSGLTQLWKEKVAPASPHENCCPSTVQMDTAKRLGSADASAGM